MHSDMIRVLPKEYRRDAWVQDILSICQQALDSGVLIPAEQLGGELLLSRMSARQLAVEERLCNIRPAAGAKLADRKAAVAARWKTNGRMDLAQLQALCESWTSGEVVADYVDGRLTLQFVGSYGVPEDMDGLMTALEDARPAHIPIDYRYRYLLVREVKTMTVAELQGHSISDFAF